MLYTVGKSVYIPSSLDGAFIPRPTSSPLKCQDLESLQVQSCDLPVEAEADNGIPQSIYPVSCLRFEAGISRIQVRSFTMLSGREERKSRGSGVANPPLVATDSASLFRFPHIHAPAFAPVPRF
jgi:hypothetical protein